MKRWIIGAAVVGLAAVPAAVAQTANVGTTCTKAQHGTVTGSTICARTGATTYAWVEPTPTGKGFRDGQWRVGIEVAPGRYRSPGAAPASFEYCTVAVLDEKDNYRASEQSDGATKPVIIRVPAAGAYKVTSSGCQPFLKIG